LGLNGTQFDSVISGYLIVRFGNVFAVLIG